ncbi:hypothetical protein ACNVED_14965 (plasmid) [Legionella sp. D16C41]|uniref:hypothetical protein n=1 Tax=Legionella sp. D16C41 TaxID=3402688 RepID=UPI003AF4ABB2
MTLDRSVKKQNYNEIKQEWESLQSLGIKIRFKLMRTLAHNICELFKKNITELHQLEFYIDVLKQVNLIHDVPRFKRTLSKMIAKWLDLKGFTSAKISKKKSGTINTETSTVAIGDPYYLTNIIKAYNHYSEKNILALINEAQSYVFSTGYDGLLNIQIRIINSVEPVLLDKEYKYIWNATEIGIISIPTGTLAVADPCFLDVKNNRLCINIEPGNYKVCVYLIQSKIESFYIVLCKTDQEAKNYFSKLPEFN